MPIPGSTVAVVAAAGGGASAAPQAGELPAAAPALHPVCLSARRWAGSWMPFWGLAVRGRACGGRGRGRDDASVSARPWGKDSGRQVGRGYAATFNPMEGRKCGAVSSNASVQSAMLVHVQLTTAQQPQRCLPPCAFSTAQRRSHTPPD